MSRQPSIGLGRIMTAISKGSDGFDPDYLAILAQAAMLGYALPTQAQQVKQNVLLMALKPTGIWPLLDILYIFANDGSAEFATLNWKAPASFQCTRVNSPTFTLNVGYNGNGTTSYLSTNWVPRTNGVNYLLNDCSAGGHSATDTQENGVLFGCSSNGPLTRFLLTPRSTGNTFSITGIHNNTIWSAANSGGIGLFMGQRRASNDSRIFKNGVQMQTNAVAPATLKPSAAMTILSSNESGNQIGFSTKQVSMFFAGASLAGKEASFNNIWTNYLTSL